jgi:hypothetical protein
MKPEIQRWQFTTPQGYGICTVEALTGPEAREKALGHPRAPLDGVMFCSHLGRAGGLASDWYGCIAPDMETLAEESGARG